MGPVIRRYALLVAALLVVTGAAAAAHVHRGERDSSPLHEHAHTTCAFCVTAGNTAEPAIHASVIPPVLGLSQELAPTPVDRPTAQLKSPARGRAPPL